MSILVCGSMAFDSIMVFQDYFKNHIMPDQIHKLSVAFYVPEMKKNFGGTAGNIGYNLNLVAADFLIMSTVGEDFSSYHDWLELQKINTKYLTQINKTFTAQAFITTDLDDNQITAFHPGAMSASHHNSILKINEKPKLILISPDGKDGMIQHANESFMLNIPFIFDPGQGLPMFNQEELISFIDKASYITVNDYEAELLVKNSGLSLQEIGQQVEGLVITKGASGATIFEKGKSYDVPAFKVDKPIDPTGCGDAFRAGLAFGIIKKWGLEQSAKLGSALAFFKIQSQGGQNHKPSLSQIEDLVEFKLNT